MSKAERIRIQRLIARLGRLEDDSARRHRLLLEALRRDVLGELAQARGFRREQLGAIMREIDRHVATGRTLAEAAVSNSTRDAWTVGLEVADVTLGPRSMTGVSGSMLDAILDVTTDQTRAVWTELGSKLKRTVRRAVLGIDDPYKAMQALAKSIRNPSVFADAFTRAEVIVRTEVNRTYSMATNDRAQQAADAIGRTGGSMVKWWLTAHDDRVREAHVQAGEDYTEDNAIPVDQPFIVDDEPLMYPLDPQGSAANTIQCRCVMLVKEAGAVVEKTQGEINKEESAKAIEKAEADRLARRPSRAKDKGPVSVKPADFGDGGRGIPSVAGSSATVPAATSTPKESAPKRQKSKPTATATSSDDMPTLSPRDFGRGFKLPPRPKK